MNNSIRKILATLLTALALFVIAPKSAQADGRNVIIYYPNFEQMAIELHDKHESLGTATDLVNLADIYYYYSSDPGISWPENNTGDWINYWAQRNNEPLKIMAFIQGIMGGDLQKGFYAGMGKRIVDLSQVESGPPVKSITLLGSTGHIPSSTSLAYSLHGEDNDYFYSLRNLNDLLPDFAVSRIPITVTDASPNVFNSQLDAFTMNDYQNGIFRGILNDSYTARGLVGETIGFDSFLKGALRSFPFVTNILNNSATTTRVDEQNNSREETVILISSGEADLKATIDPNYPYFATLQKVDEETGEELVNFTLDEEVYAKGTVVVYGDKGLTTLIDYAEVTTPFGETTILFKQPENLIPSGITKVLPSGINQKKLIIRSTENAFSGFGWPDYDPNLKYIIKTSTEKDAQSRIFIPTFWGISPQGFHFIEVQGDDASKLGSNDTLFLFNYTDVVSYDTNAGFASFLLPKEILTSGTGYLLFLDGVATAMIKKINDYSEYIWNTEFGNPDFFSNILLGANDGLANEWMFRDEHLIENLLNYFHPTVHQATKSILNGFNIFKAFDSNDGNISDSAFPRFRLTSTDNSQQEGQDVMDATVGKAFVTLVGEWWNGINSNSIFTNQTNPTLPVFIGGAAFANPDMDIYNIITPFAAGFGHGALLKIPSSGYEGAIGLIGQDNGVTFQNSSVGGGSEKIKIIRGGKLTIQEWSHELLIKNAYRSYVAQANPQLGVIWSEAIHGYLQQLVDEGSETSLTSAARSSMLSLIGWHCTGDAALEFPAHRFWTQAELTVPVIDFDESQFREVSGIVPTSDSYDRDNIPLFEVEYNSTKTVTISIADNGVNQFRVTLVSPQLIYPLISSSAPSTIIRKVHEIDESNLTTEETLQTSFLNNQNSISFTFYDKWSRGNNAGDLLQRGPGLFMVKVEVLEKDRSNNPFITPSAQKQHYSKESRIFFRVVNKFDNSKSAPILLVDNTQREPYNVRSTVSPAPSTFIRYYESALENYQFTSGTVSLSNGTTFIHNAPANNPIRWGQGSEELIAPGDKIRFRGSNELLWSDWFRVSSITSQSSTFLNSLTVADPKGALADFNTDGTAFVKSAYIVQRTFNEGYVELAYTADPTTGKKVFGNTALLYTRTGASFETTWNDNEIVKAGDWFKLLDEGTYKQIASVSFEGTAKLTFVDDYPSDTLNIIHIGGFGFSSIFKNDSKVRGSYAIYADDDGEPNYQYRIWRTHNFNTTNVKGQGVHGDVTKKVLDSYALANSRTVVWANESSYNHLPWRVPTARHPFQRPFELTHFPVLGSIYSNTNNLNYENYLFSDSDRSHISEFFDAGGRMYTGGQFFGIKTPGIRPAQWGSPDEEFYSKYFGVVMSNGFLGTSDFNNAHIGKSELVGIPDDEISLSLNILPLEGGDVPLSKNMIDSEASSLGARNSSLVKTAEALQSFLYNTASGQGPSVGFDFHAGVRVFSSGNPWGTLVTGFDFGTVSQSGINNEFRVGDQSPVFGRNRMMKNIIDWLRAPTEDTANPEEDNDDDGKDNDDDSDGSTVIGSGSGGRGSFRSSSSGGGCFLR